MVTYVANGSPRTEALTGKSTQLPSKRSTWRLAPSDRRIAAVRLIRSLAGTWDGDACRLIALRLLRGLLRQARARAGDTAPDPSGSGRSLRGRVVASGMYRLRRGLRAGPVVAEPVTLAAPGHQADHAADHQGHRDQRPDAEQQLPGPGESSSSSCAMGQGCGTLPRIGNSVPCQARPAGSGSSGARVSRRVGVGSGLAGGGVAFSGKWQATWWPGASSTSGGLLASCRCPAPSSSGCGSGRPAAG